MPNEPVLAVRELTSDYGALRVLEAISFDVAEGELLAVVGPSGCGKSTLLRTLGGLLAPSAGSVRLRGGEVTGRRPGDVGFVFQSPVLLPWRTVLANVRLPEELLARPGRRTSRELIELVGLAGFEGAYPDQLSGGMKQRAAVARALSFDPAILLMDEPFGAVDELGRERLGLELLRIRAEVGATIVLVTHSVPEAVLMADRVLVLSGRPARALALVEVPLPATRTSETLTSSAYVETVAHVRRLLNG